jgi:hypothetical protein
MSLDQQGYLWVTNPWIATLAIVVAVTIVVWCDRLLREERIDASVAVPVRTEPTSRQRRTRGASDDHGLSYQSVAGRERRHGRPRRAA